MLYGFLTTAPNDEVKPVHAKAMRAILTTLEECDSLAHGGAGRGLGAAAATAGRATDDCWERRAGRSAAGGRAKRAEPTLL
jgi:hypothetical protein